MKFVGTHLMNVRAVEADGVTPLMLNIPITIPSDMIPGEYIMWLRKDGVQEIYMLIDKGRFGMDNGNGWNIAATISVLKPEDVFDENIADTRTRLLKAKGWLG